MADRGEWDVVDSRPVDGGEHITGWMALKEARPGAGVVETRVGKSLGQYPFGFEFDYCLARAKRDVFLLISGKDERLIYFTFDDAAGTARELLMGIDELEIWFVGGEPMKYLYERQWLAREARAVELRGLRALLLENLGEGFADRIDQLILRYDPFRRIEAAWERVVSISDTKPDA